MILRRLFLCALCATPAFADDGVEALQRRLAGLSAEANAAVLDVAWPSLDDQRAPVRAAARVAIQAQPFDRWKERALEEKSTWPSLELLRALVESCPRPEAAGLSPHLCEQITTLRFEQMDAAQWLAAARVTRLLLEKLGPVTEDERQQMIDLWTMLPPSSDPAVTRERVSLLEFLREVRSR